MDPLHFRFLETKISHSGLRGVPIKGTGIPVNYRNYCNFCSFLVNKKGISKKINNLAKLRNKDKKVAFIQVHEDEALARSYEFMKISHNMSVMVQTTGRDASSLNGNSENPNKANDNITRYLLLNLSHKE